MSRASGSADATVRLWCNRFESLVPAYGNLINNYRQLARLIARLAHLASSWAVRVLADTVPPDLMTPESKVGKEPQAVASIW